MTPSDCGRDFKHDQHIYLTPTGKKKACDGEVNKDVTGRAT